MFVIGPVIKRWVSYSHDNVILISRISSTIKTSVFVISFLFPLFACRQFIFVVGFSTFLLECVNYDILFANSKNDTHKVTIPEAVAPFGQCVQE